MKRLMLILLAGVVLSAFSSVVYARDHGGGHGGGPGPGGHDGGRGGYRGDYHGGYRGWGYHPRPFVVVPPPCRPVYISPPRSGIYVGVGGVAVGVSSSSVGVWVSNGHGNRVQVMLNKCDNGYRGPRGEYYSCMPRETELRVLYAPPPPVTTVIVPAQTTVVMPSPAPVIVPNPSVTVWITNDNGSQTPVTLRQQGTGFVGPLNEYYANLPNEDQLKSLYGLKSNAPIASTLTIWITDSDGSKIPVVLTKEGTEYVGPKGEHYVTVPTEEQLKSLYGQAPVKVDSGTVVIWVDNGDGSKTPVTLQKDGDGYLGPAGERYATVPTEEQLKVLYCASTVETSTELSFEITKKNGSKTLVALKKEGTQFVGPKGERYDTIPSQEQLALIYGK